MAAVSRLTREDYAHLASVLINRHGVEAVAWADRCIEDLDNKGEIRRAASWRALRVFIAHQIGAGPARLMAATVH